MKVHGELVRVLRERRSWSQDHLASAAGLSARTIQRVEAEGVASAETRLALAAALDVPVAELMEESAIMNDVPVAELMEESAITNVDPARPWRVPRWGWLGWSIVTIASIGLIAFGRRPAGMPLRQMALNLFPWLMLLGICLGVVALIGVWQRSGDRSRR